MKVKARLIDRFKRNQWVINAQAEGLTHDDSLLEPPFRGNSMNWVLGHIVANRDSLLLLLGEQAGMKDAAIELYQRGSKPLGQGKGAVNLETLLDVLSGQAERMEVGLDRMTPAELATVVDVERQGTVGDRIDFLIWHETYHVGQLEYLRQLAGTDDAIIK